MLQPGTGVSMKPEIGVRAKSRKNGTAFARQEWKRNRASRLREAARAVPARAQWRLKRNRAEMGWALPRKGLDLHQFARSKSPANLTQQAPFARLRDAADLVEPARFVSSAEVAELADARGSGPRTRKGVGVRVPSSAPIVKKNLQILHKSLHLIDLQGHSSLKL